MTGIIDGFNGYPALSEFLAVSAVLLASLASYYISKKYLTSIFSTLTKRTDTMIDDIIVKRVVLARLIYLIPVGIIYYFSYVFSPFEELVGRAAGALISFILLLSVGAFINAFTDIYQRREIAQRIPIKSHLQIIKIFIYVIGIITILGQLTGQSPWYFLTGVGVFTAIILLVFRDTILSFVATLQISSNDLFREGDWIEIPKYGADGTVVDIALHTIKVQNWDKTFTVIPTYKLLEESFKNWRGMQESGGRRIKRSIYIDISSIRFVDDKMLERYKRIHYLRDYIQEKLEEIKDYNREHDFDTSEIVNSRRLTNVGTFRAYIHSYLWHHPKIHRGLTFLVRQLPPGPDGLPIEIYVFTNTTDWVEYEGIQADIFDHLLAVAPQFGLRVFQNPTGSDIERLKDIFRRGTREANVG